MVTGFGAGVKNRSPPMSEVPRQAIEMKIDVPAENDIARKFKYIVVLAFEQGVRYVTSRMGHAKALPSNTFQEGGIYYPVALMYTLPKEPKLCSQTEI